MKSMWDRRFRLSHDAVKEAEIHAGIADLESGREVLASKLDANGFYFEANLPVFLVEDTPLVRR